MLTDPCPLPTIASRPARSAADGMGAVGPATEPIAIQVKGADEGEVRQKLEQVSGVAKVVGRDAPEGFVGFEIESMEQYAVRPDLARAIVQSGWDLTELRTVGESLEEIFLELTKSESKPAAAAHTGDSAQ